MAEVIHTIIQVQNSLQGYEMEVVVNAFSLFLYRFLELANENYRTLVIMQVQCTGLKLPPETIIFQYHTAHTRIKQTYPASHPCVY